MKIEGLKPTHTDMHTGLDYAKHNGVWYIAKALSFIGRDYQWTESYDYNEYPDHCKIYLKEIE